MIDTGNDKYIVPRGDGVGEPIILDMVRVASAQSRLQEVATVNLQNASELMSTFNEVWLELNRSVTMLTYERARAEDSLKVAHAESILDCSDEIIKKRGHAKSSEGLREAVADLDPRVRSAKERLNEIRAVYSYLDGKMQAFANAYTAVKKLVATMQLPTVPLRNNTSVYGTRLDKRLEMLDDSFEEKLSGLSPEFGEERF